MNHHRSVLPLLVAVAAGCGSDQAAGPTSAQADAIRGRLAFEQDCAGCHASRDGFDLAFFGFSDADIVRRAVKHVDTATAFDIVAAIRAMRVPPAEEDLRLFQPGGVTLGSDVAFATAMFGRDAWPADLNTAGLRAIDPREVRIALPLPVWSDEATNLDWMPDDPLPATILEFAGRQAEGAIAGYRAAPSRENLLRAVQALRVADRTPANAGAPCLLEDPARVNYEVCFEVRRWTSSLVAQHMLRHGMSGSLGGDLHDVWWDVGNVARRSRGAGTLAVERPVENWAAWMFLGWSFDPSRHPSVYTGGGFRQLGLMRHATFVALRSQVGRPAASPAVYDDLVQAVRFAPGAWTAAVATFGMRHLVERLESGDRPPRAEQVVDAAADVNAALAEVNRRVPAVERAPIVELGERVLALLGG